MDGGDGNLDNLVGAHGKDPVISVRRNRGTPGKCAKGGEHKDVAVPPEAGHLQASAAPLRQPHNRVQVTGEGGDLGTPLRFMHHLNPSLAHRRVDHLKTPAGRGSAPASVVVSEQQANLKVG